MMVKMGNMSVGIEIAKTLCRTWNTILGRNNNTIVSSQQKHHLHVGTKTFLRPYSGPKMLIVTSKNFLLAHQFYWIQIIFLSETKCLWLPQYVPK